MAWQLERFCDAVVSPLAMCKGQGRACTQRGVWGRTRTPSPPVRRDWARGARARYRHISSPLPALAHATSPLTRACRSTPTEPSWRGVLSRRPRRCLRFSLLVAPAAASCALVRGFEAPEFRAPPAAGVALPFCRVTLASLTTLPTSPPLPHLNRLQL